MNPSPCWLSCNPFVGRARSAKYETVCFFKNRDVWGKARRDIVIFINHWFFFHKLTDLLDSGLDTLQNQTGSTSFVGCHDLRTPMLPSSRGPCCLASPSAFSPMRTSSSSLQRLASTTPKSSSGRGIFVLGTPQRSARRSSVTTSPSRYDECLISSGHMSDMTISQVWLRTKIRNLGSFSVCLLELTLSYAFLGGKDENQTLLCLFLQCYPRNCWKYVIS